MTHTLPPGWEEKTLGELCDVLDFRRKPITQKDRTSGPYPYYGATGIVDFVDSFLFDEPLLLVGEDGARWGAGDPCAFIASGKYWVNNHAHVLKPKNFMSIQYLAYFLNYSDLTPYITGTTVPKLNQQKLRSISVSSPSLPEQKRIVEKLDKIFAAIDKAKTQTEKNLQNAKDIFKSYFNQLFTPQNTKHWVEQELNRLFYITAGGDKPSVYSKYMTDKCSVPIYSNAVENQGLYGYTNESAIHLPALTISARGTIGFVCKRESPYFPIVRLLSLVPKNNENDLNFLFYAVQKVVQKSTGSSIPQLTIPMIAKEKIRYPERLEEQRHIVFSLEQFKSLTDKISLICNQKLADLEELKQAVLQQAFSGKL